MASTAARMPWPSGMPSGRRPPTTSTGAPGREISVADRAGTVWQTTAETLDAAVENLAVILALHADGVAVRLLREGADRTHHTRTTWVREGVLVEAWRRGEKAAPRIAATGRTFAEAVEKLLEQMP